MDTRKINLNLKVSQDTKDLLARLRDEGGSPTVTDVVRRALVLYKAFLATTNDGGRVILEDKKGEQETVRFL